MEQVIWLYFGIISLVLALGIIGGFFINFKEDNKTTAFDNTLTTLKEHCEMMCNAPTGQRLSVTVEIPSGVYMYTENDKVCGIFNNEERCVKCPCKINPYKLELNTTIAMKSFEIQPYHCAMEKLEKNVTLECQG